MHKRIAPTLALLSIVTFALGVPLRIVKAQDQVFRVLKTVGTPDEKPQIDAVVGRLRTKFTGDPTFEKTLDDAMVKRDFAAARSVIARTAQVRAEEIVIGLPKKTSRLDTESGSYLRFASAKLNPWYAIVITKSTAFCVGLFKSGADECRAALREAGFTPTN